MGTLLSVKLGLYKIWIAASSLSQNLLVGIERRSFELKKQVKRDLLKSGTERRKQKIQGLSSVGRTSEAENDSLAETPRTNTAQRADKGGGDSDLKSGIRPARPGPGPGTGPGLAQRPRTQMAPIFEIGPIDSENESPDHVINLDRIHTYPGPSGQANISPTDRLTGDLPPTTMSSDSAPPKPPAWKRGRMLFADEIEPFTIDWSE